MKSAIRYPIRVQKLNWKYGNREILSDITLTFDKGKFYSIIGPNGSGKTTLLKNISKSLEPAAGSVFIDHMDIIDLGNRDIAKKLSLVPQNTNIDFEFTVTDIVLMGRSPYIKRFQTESPEDVGIAEKAMKATNTWHLKDKNINEISGGERQRAILARALAQDTGIMLLDEPVSQLDIHHQIELMETIHSLMKTRDFTVISVMHDLNLAARYSDFLILMKEGKIICHGTPQQVITRENIGNVYRLDAYVIDNPITTKPYIMHVKRGDYSQGYASPVKQ